MQGKIMKGIAGFYYVHVPGMGIYECKAKGVFRKNNQKPLVGDNVLLDVLDEEDKLGNVTEILSRKNQLLRPAVANVDQALIIFSIEKPQPNFNLLDRFLVMMEQQGIPSVICFNKSDIDSKDVGKEYEQIYSNCGYLTLAVSAVKEEGISKLHQVLSGKTTTVAGPSGVGKSSLINCLQHNVVMEIGAISEKIERGKHTTRHSEIIAIGDGSIGDGSIGEDTYIFDTPGFSSLGLHSMEKEELTGYYREFAEYEKMCRFNHCSHIGEPDCGVKNAVAANEIAKQRYDNYCQLYNELKMIKKY